MTESIRKKELALKKLNAEIEAELAKKNKRADKKKFLAEKRKALAEERKKEREDRKKVERGEREARKNLAKRLVSSERQKEIEFDKKLCEQEGWSIHRLTQLRIYHYYQYKLIHRWGYSNYKAYWKNIIDDLNIMSNELKITKGGSIFYNFYLQGYFSHNASFLTCTRALIKSEDKFKIPELKVVKKYRDVLRLYEKFKQENKVFR